MTCYISKTIFKIKNTKYGMCKYYHSCDLDIFMRPRIWILLKNVVKVSRNIMYFNTKKIPYYPISLLYLSDTSIFIKTIYA